MHSIKATTSPQLNKFLSSDIWMKFCYGLLRVHMEFHTQVLHETKIFAIILTGWRTLKFHPIKALPPEWKKEVMRKIRKLKRNEKLILKKV